MYSLPYPHLRDKGHDWHLLLSSLFPNLTATAGTTPGSPQIGSFYLTISYHQLPSSCGKCPFIPHIEGSLPLWEYLLEVLLNSLDRRGILRDPASKETVSGSLPLLLLLSLGEFSSLCYGHKWPVQCKLQFFPLHIDLLSVTVFYLFGFFIFLPCHTPLP